MMIACVSPADSNFEESLNTLRYADRARKIKNKAVINRDPQQAEIIRLKKELELARASGGGGGVVEVEESEEYRMMKEKYEAELMDIKTAFRSSTSDYQSLLLKVEKSESDRQQLSTKLDKISKHAATLKLEHQDMTLLEGQLDDEDSAVSETFRALRALHTSLLDVQQDNKSRRISFAVIQEDKELSINADMPGEGDEIHLDGVNAFSDDECTTPNANVSIYSFSTCYNILFRRNYSELIRTTTKSRISMLRLRQRSSI